ncbi:hypothetical protein Y695_02206 [Hydrogenophaga sp. T4]|nr:hypothetical protein Y695_02206 [Hydrogenophaga sp. T4]
MSSECLSRRVLRGKALRPGTSRQPTTRPSDLQTVNVQYTPPSSLYQSMPFSLSRGKVKRVTGNLIMMWWS